jgi:hypothetical protein
MLNQSIDPKLIEEIRHRNKLDVELYNYAKEVFND